MCGRAGMLTENFALHFFKIAGRFLVFSIHTVFGGTRICHSKPLGEESRTAGSKFDKCVGNDLKCRSARVYRILRVVADADPYGVLRCRWLCSKSNFARAGVETRPYELC